MSHVTLKSIQVWLHNKCHKIYLRGPFGIFCLYVILTISYLRAQTVETSSLPKDSSRPLFKQIEICLTVYFNCKYFPSYTRELQLQECFLGISPSGRNPCGGKKSPLTLVIWASVKFSYISYWKQAEARSTRHNRQDRILRKTVEDC